MKTKVLLDTCTWLWVNMEHPRINTNVQAYLAATIWCVSAISVWEIAMLVQKGRLELTMPVRRWVKQALTETASVILLPLSPEISILSCELPMIHADPADRIIMATAQQEGIPLVTADKTIVHQAKSLNIETYLIR